MLIIRDAKSSWLKASEAAPLLGFSINSLNCWRKCGYLKQGKHWRYSTQSSGNVAYNLDQCKREMNEWWGRDAMTGSLKREY